MHAQYFSLINFCANASVSLLLILIAHNDRLPLLARQGDALHQADVWQQERGSAGLSGAVRPAEELVPRPHPGLR